MRLRHGTRRILAVSFVCLTHGCAALPERTDGVARHTTSPAARDTTIDAQAAAEHGAALSSTGRKLRGRFLHISDIHPDPYYKAYSSTEELAACHRGSGSAGAYGAETSDCDTPLALVNATFKWIDENIKDDIDFVVWTGDSARHDNDENIPRTPKQIIEQNRLIVSKFIEVFGKPDNIDDPDPTNDFIIPIVPTFGNNDIMPHNIFMSGPNEWTLSYLDVWRNFIPEAQRHQFQTGGWFSVEVIPDRLQVISINSIYFFDSNSAVDGCSIKSEPGFDHMEWLRIQLQILRQRGVKAILIGHVPPARTENKMSWDESCWQKYTLWMQQYRDVVVASLYGHMNIDHFMLHDFNEVDKEFRKGIGKVYEGEDASEAGNGRLTIAGAKDYLLDLRDKWANLPRPSKSKSLQTLQSSNESHEASILDHAIELLLGKFSNKKSHNRKHKKGKGKKPDDAGGEWSERYSVSIVGPSVVPNYFPTLRIFEYNTTGLDNAASLIKSSKGREAPRNSDTTKHSLDSRTDDIFNFDLESALLEQSTKKGKHGKKPGQKRVRKHKFEVPKPPSKSSPPGPAYSPQTLSLLGYTQLFANLTYINNDFTHDNNTLVDKMEEFSDFEPAKWKAGKHKDKKPPGTGKGHKPHPREFAFELEYSTFDDAVYGLKDLTVGNFVALARRIGGSTKAAEEENLDDHWAIETEDEGEESDVETEKKKKKKKKGKHKKKRKATKAWHTFVSRAFVGTIDAETIEELYGAADEAPMIDEVLEL